MEKKGLQYIWLVEIMLVIQLLSLELSSLEIILFWAGSLVHWIFHKRRVPCSEPSKTRNYLMVKRCWAGRSLFGPDQFIQRKGEMLMQRLALQLVLFSLIIKKDQIMFFVQTCTTPKQIKLESLVFTEIVYLLKTWMTVVKYKEIWS